ncbi:hypothetical protein SBI_09318 [Streptomyces bingchenggensis BCW-1]|uniref:Uncharacterized protein n=1 Tax=Streptomyces bingchenggensis (strain BCW-1) TaxID=749414 RepID=D7C5Q7_STRBB|nr:hypothetical protein SBI_09318 [Streptomyces bingchenggensis BCW-1]
MGSMTGERRSSQARASREGLAPYVLAGFFGILRRSPDAWSGQLHRSVSEPVDRQVTADSEDSGGVGGTLAFLCHGVPLAVGWLSEEVGVVQSLVRIGDRR